MKIMLPFPLVSCLLLAISLWGCKAEKSSAPVQEASTDTRKLVRDAYASIDPFTVPYAFNTDKAAIIKERLDAEADPGKKVNLRLEYAMELLRAGNTQESMNQYAEAVNFVIQNGLGIGPKEKRELYSTIAIAYLRHGEIENCVQNHNHQSCFLPIAGAGVHQLPFGSTNAIKYLELILTEFPDDLESKYLLNLAYQTLGQYPDKVPAKWRIDPVWYTNKRKIEPFKDIAPALGLNRNTHAGGVVMDDFNNDGWLDIIVTSWHRNAPAIFYHNNGDGTFTDKTNEVGLDGQVGSLNLNQTDFNNDGWLDLYIMRGAWYGPSGDIPNTLMMNTGKGTFVDVTIQAGLTKNAATQTSSWADFNLDGWLDLLIANESVPGYLRGIDLYINQKDGTFSHQSEAYGLTQNEFFKGCVATDVNNDKYPDLYISGLSRNPLLLINQGFKGVAGFIPADGSSIAPGPAHSFPCWSFDYDNDGHEDLFVSPFSNEGSPSTMWIKSHGSDFDHSFLPTLNHNKGNGQFEEVGQSMGLNEVCFSMGCNFGDINSDGFLDFYLGTGNPLYQSIVPNKMYMNVDGRKFEDVSYSGGVANIQKGHGVSFGDWNHDGDEDIFAVIGGAYDGDAFYNCFFENPNQDNHHWIVLNIEGTTANKAAIGARVAITALENGKERMIYRTVSSGASFGANSLALEVGLRKATKIKNAIVQWPCKDCPDSVFEGLEINKSYKLVQGSTVAQPQNYMTVAAGDKEGHSTHSH
ncbi:MAG TPA: VCBS repeat-containing protein [Saprospiraceae bacterium]|nr:VCBS repeat-containing protein [Saprospiraceae bacterium]